MNQDTLMDFITRIIKNGTEKQSELVLQQLANILDTQGDKTSSAMVLDSISAVPELKQTVKRTTLNDRELRIARQRAAERRMREMEASRMGRCC